MKMLKRVFTNQTKRDKKQFRRIFLVMLTVSVMIYAFLVSGAVYSPSSNALTAMQSDDKTTVTDAKQYIHFSNNGKMAETSQGFLLYPHDEIDPKAYATLAKAINQKFGTDVYVLKYPMNHFWLGFNSGKQLASNSDITSWHVIMHGNGGLLGQFVLPETTTSMVYLSSYPLFHIETSNDVMIVRGSLDQVNDDRTWAKKRKLFPKNSIVYEIPKGNFSYFADFGLHAKDSAGIVTANEQLQLTLEYLEDFIIGL